MNQTENLSLPQWEADDRIMRTDFNVAFAALDAGVKAANDAIAAKADAASVTALANRVSAVESGKANAADLSTETAARQASDLVVKLIDFTQSTDTLNMEVSLSGIHVPDYSLLLIRPSISTSSGKITMLINDISSKSYTNGSNWTDSCCTFSPLNGSHDAIIRLVPNERGVFVYASSLVDYGSSAHTVIHAKFGTSFGNEISSVNFIPASDCTITAGSRVLVYGLKK